jgi:hypothetical protein
MEGRFTNPDLLFFVDRLTDIPGLVRELIDCMGPEFKDRARRAWGVSRVLYPHAWTALDSMYAAVPKPPSPIFTQGRHSIFGDEHEPTVAELKALGRPGLNRLWLDVARRRDQLRRMYGDQESFVDSSLRRDRQLIEADLQEIDADGDRGG